MNDQDKDNRFDMALTKVALRFLHCLDPETAHGITIKSLKAGLYPRARANDPDILQQQLWGIDFSNPVGLAAGFDKNAEVPMQMLDIGFGFVEVGTITPLPQAGNPRPRLFRLPEDRAVINRNGFNSAGAAVGFERLKQLQTRRGPGRIVGLNLGANKDSADRIADYVNGVKNSKGLGDYYVINISSPNTPGLRELQGKDALDRLLGLVQDARDAQELDQPVPVLVKIAPDLDDAELKDIAETLLNRKIDGVIISNTTIGYRDQLKGASRDEVGGLSGRPLFNAATEILGRFYQLTEGKLPLIGVGGVENAETAYRKIRAGASLLQLYTALIYGGPQLVAEIKQGLAERLSRDGFRNVNEAVGAEWR